MKNPQHNSAENQLSQTWADRSPWEWTHGQSIFCELRREREAARRHVWRRQCEVVQLFGRNRFEVGFTTEEGNEALITAGLPTLDSEQMGRALKASHEARQR